jgi:hypothetical protein
LSTTLVLAGTLLAGGESKKSGPIGLAVILVLCVACYFLFKSMSKHLRKVREEFPADAPARGGELSAPVRPAATAQPGEATAPRDSAQPAEAPPPSDEPA